MLHREVAPRKDFLREKVSEDAASGRFGRPIHTRFPLEPNGFLHIGHAKSICLNFGIAREFGGFCNLWFDDTNPTTEDIRYVDTGLVSAAGRAVARAEALVGPDDR
jgi:glutaminyl-tRNA synthetase